jgi:hypothetical protein
MKKLLCLIKHNWNYHGPFKGPFSKKRSCSRCGKRQVYFNDEMSGWDGLWI